MADPTFEDAESLVAYVLSNGPELMEGEAAAVHGFIRCGQYAHALDLYLLTPFDSFPDEELLRVIRRNIGVLESYDAYEDVAELVGAQIY